MTVRCGVGDILSAICPFDFVAVVLHQTDEVFSVTGLCHALVHGDLQVHLPASALGIGTVLPVGHGSLLPLFLLLRLHNRKTVLHGVEPKTAAMMMAIVADKMGKPLNELRFISIKEVE